MLVNLRKWRTEVRRYKFKDKVKGSQQNLAAALQPRTAGSQGESPCRAIHAQW